MKKVEVKKLKAPKGCFLCRADNLRKEFDRSGCQTTLSMFRSTVGRAFDALAIDPDYFSRQECRHVAMLWDDVLQELEVAQNQASTDQKVKVLLFARVAARCVVNG